MPCKPDVLEVQGFKISLLLKLQDIKATDRTTSLLQFCIQQAADKSSTLESMSAQLPSIKPAARLQVTAIDTLLAELTTGIKQAQRQVEHASGLDESAAGAVQVCSCCLTLQAPRCCDH